MINQVPSGSFPCHVDMNSKGDKLISACYGGSSVRLFDVKRDGGLNEWSKDVH